MNRPADLARLLRPHQWIKNGFVFTGLLFAHAWHDPLVMMQVIAAAAAFSLISSSVYIINDLVDRERDRLHPVKKRRPLAAGTVSKSGALGLAITVGVVGVGLGMLASPMVVLILVVYAGMNLAYSLGLKHVVILDVFLIAAGFMLRILAGTIGVGIPPSNWLLLCGLMVTLFLGFAKRRAEIISLDADRAQHRKVLEHYSPVLLDKMIGITATGVIMSYSLYTMSPDTVLTHGTRNLIFTVPFVMYGIFRYIYLLHQQQGGGDPAREVAHDPHLLVSIGGWLIATLLLIG